MRAFSITTLILLGLCAPGLFAQPGSAAQAVSPIPAAQSDSQSLTPAQISALVAECGRRTTQMTARILDYTYTETAVEYEVDKAGKVKVASEKAYEVYPVWNRKGGYVRIQVSENGSPLGEEKVARERERAAKSLAEVGSAAGGQQPAAAAQVSTQRGFASFGIGVEQHRHGGMSKTFWSIRPTDFLTAHDFYAPVRTVYHARAAILLSYRPRPGHVYDRTNVPFKDGVEDYGRVMSQLGGRVWIDADEKVIVRLEAFPSSEAGRPSELPADSPLGFESQRLPDGTWVPARSWYNSYGREDFFWKTPISRERRYSDFKKFKVNVGDAKVDAPPER
jgi:hypothetical protein